MAIPRIIHRIIGLTLLLSTVGVDGLSAHPAFEFRALCTPANNDPKTWGVVSTHNVDNDWGLWGHNIWRVVGKKPSKEVYAIVNGERDTTQYCFTSPILYKMLEEWIIDQWGFKGQRFSVIPGDNKRVCQCYRCKQIGNTRTSATPAVADMLTKLAQRFPDHQFFMASYHSTTEPPKKPLPKNAGVMLSTMAIPFRYNFYENKGFRKFDDILKAWKAVTPLLYVWEYNRNFDDYLSPYPNLYALQERFRYYRKAGITGMFINGSGYDYCTFDDVQSYVTSRLMLDPDVDIERLVRTFYNKYYPKCGGMIADYYLTLERRVKETNHILPYYGTIEEEVESYLDPKEFTDFWIALDKKSKTVTGEERKLVSGMLTAMAYTRLMLHPSPEDREELLIILSDYKSVPGLLNTKESYSPIEEFLLNYKKQ